MKIQFRIGGINNVLFTAYVTEEEKRKSSKTKNPEMFLVDISKHRLGIGKDTRCYPIKPAALTP